jgi:group II intron reverse transcriptase/maturase
MTEDKPFSISKWAVHGAWMKVRANRGAAGVDGESIKVFERKLKDNLYRIWNRMSSGSYFPPPVKRVMIPKADGKERPLGIPTVGDRVAQMVVKRYLEPKVEPLFHPDSYGYRPRKSALEAVGKCRERCWRYDWIVDLDIKGFFDNIDHTLMMHAVRKHTDCPWMLLYIERWLKAPAEEADGTQVARDRGTPQGGVISPLLANIFLHHVFDTWMTGNFPGCPFERYADDIVIHCSTREEALAVKAQVEERLRACKLEAHPDKTRIVYCQDSNRREDHEHIQFDFFELQFSTPRGAKPDGEDLHQLSAGDQSPCRPRRRDASQGLGPPAQERRGTGRTVAELQSRNPRLDRLLRPLLPNRSPQHLSPTQRATGAVGPTEIQAIPRS